MVTKASVASIAVLALLMIAVAFAGIKLLGHDFTGAASTISLACGSTSPPACGGTCPAGQTCVTKSSGGLYSTNVCACQTPISVSGPLIPAGSTVPNGSSSSAGTVNSVSVACAASLPACNGTCPAGQTCGTQTTAGGVVTCVCQAGGGGGGLNCSQIDPTKVPCSAGVCSVSGQLCVTTKWGPDGMPLECGCEENCLTVSNPNNCSQAVCLNTTGQANPNQKCIKAPVGSTQVCACQNKTCEECSAPCPFYSCAKCEGPKLRGGVVYCDANMSRPDQCVCHYQGLTCNKLQCNANCEKNADCPNGNFSCVNQNIVQDLGACDVNSCNCTMGSQNVVGNCTGTGENDWCFSPSSKNDCNACNDKGDQDGDQNGWTDAIADQCDANCVFDFEVHVNGTTIGPNKYENVEKSCSDGLDNDCDGKTDKADIDCLECKSGDTRACGNGKGECKQGTQTCTANNTWGACTGGVGPKNETCNRKDDNCNGKIDETWDDDSDGFVVNATACKGNYTQFDCDDTNPAIRPGAIEICIDKIDNNCNRLIDSASEGCNATNLTQSLVPKFTIGNGICEPPGETQQNAPIDCGCPEGFDLVGNKCEEDKPQQVCGNDMQEAPEQCDGTDSSLCPGLCSVDCSCPFIVGDGICSKDAGETRANSPDDCKTSPVLIIGIILLIVILSAVGAGYYLTHKKKQLADLTEAHQVEMPSTETEGNIDAYINNTLSLGFKPDDIRDSLIKAGWDTDTIDSALEDAHTDLQKLGGSAEKYGVDIAREDVEKVDSYIKDMRAQNYSPTQIKTTLESAGWPASTVETEIGKLTQPELQKSAEKAGVDKPSKDSKGAEEWASDVLNKGHTAEQVRGTLETAGWPPSDVKAAVKV